MQNARASDKQKFGWCIRTIGMLLNWNFAFRIRIEHTHTQNRIFIPSWSALIRSHTAMNIACDMFHFDFFLSIMLLLLMLFDSSWYILWPPPALDIVVPKAHNSPMLMKLFSKWFLSGLFLCDVSQDYLTFT